MGKKQENQEFEWRGKGFSFFSNEKCEYFPCHKVKEGEEFNCLFCYCPLYDYADCGGGFVLMENGSKDCSSCMFPHRKENYGEMIARLMKLRAERYK